MKRDSTAACRVVINCFDENGDLLTNASPAHPYVKGDIFANVSANYQNIYGGGYVSSDSTSDLYFEVGPNVASVRVLVARGSSSFGLRSFKIFAAPSRARAVTAYTGFEGKYIQPRTVRGSAAPSSGAWQAADICYNNAPSAGGNLGWVCVTSGSPGVWKAFGAIES